MPPSSMEMSTATAPAKHGLRAALAVSLRENSPLILSTLLYIGVVNLIAASLGVRQSSFSNLVESYEVFASVCFASLSVAFIVWLLHLTIKRDVSIKSAEAWRLMHVELFSCERLLLTLPILLLWPLLAKAFSLMKALVPMLQPFYLDPALSSLDRALHFGRDPWTLLQPILGHPWATLAIDSVYALWFFVIYFAVLSQAVAVGHRRLRMQFLMSFTLAWLILGCLFATLLSSAGPCYYAYIVGTPDPYAPLMSYLRDTVEGAKLSFFSFEFSPHLVAVNVQDMLWHDYQTKDFGFGRGISAAPSLHVASAWLVARMIHAYSRRAAIFGWGFFACILTGSVHLGWHYACDGYIAAAGAWTLWRLVGWWLDRPAVQRFLWPQAARA